MANYYSMCRTNYFSVTDTDRLEKIINSCIAESEVKLFKNDKEDKYGFYCYCNLIGLREKDKDTEEGIDEYDNLLNELQKILPSEEAIMIMAIGNEKMRYLTATYQIITKDEIRTVDFREIGLEVVRDMLNNPEFETQTVY